MKKSCWLAIGLALLITSTLWGLVSAAGPPEDDPDQDSGRRVGLVSTQVKCLAVQSGVSDTASATVRLQWEGQVEEAFLVLVAAGSRGGHGIYVNGQRVASAPVRLGGSLCRSGSQAAVLGPTDMIPIPIEALAKGENVITLTNYADVNDGWTAANLHIEIHGVLTGPPAAALEFAPLARPRMDPTGTASVSGTVLLTSTYELSQGSVISQLVWYQVPTGYTGGVSVPLVIGIHGMGGTGEWIRGFLGAEANDRGWLLAAPDMHGNYYVNTGQYALAWPGAQHDIMDTVQYMMSQYEVDPLHIYIAGYSMGGQTTAMMAAKYPDVFAAAVPWKPLTDLTDWYYEIEALDNPYNILTVIERETAGTYGGTDPSEAPFEYQRRSPILMPQNSRPIAIKMWHDVDDELVPIHHSQDLKDAIDRWGPVTPATLIEVPSGENDCPPDSAGDFEHCYHPPPADVLDFLDNFTLNAGPPLSLTIRTDESKPYHWLDLAQTGGDHWSEVAAAYSPASRTVTATISDTQSLNLAFNLGSAHIVEGGIERPGMGLPATTYLVKGGGNYRLEAYTSGYLVAPLTTEGHFTLTVSAIAVEASADPPWVAGGRIATSTITAIARDQLGNPVPDSTMVEFSTTEGTFPNGRATYFAGAAGGQATAILSLGPSAGIAQVAASVEGVTGTTTVVVDSVEIYLPVVTRAL